MTPKLKRKHRFFNKILRFLQTEARKRANRFDHADLVLRAKTALASSMMMVMFSRVISRLLSPGRLHSKAICCPLERFARAALR